jgi:hypothetical protein
MKKYAVAVVTGLAGGTASYVWSAAAPASSTLSSYFGVTKSRFAFVTGSFYGGSLFGLFFGMACLSQFGLRKVTVFSCVLLLIGTVIRLVGYQENSVGFILLLVGNAVAGLPVSMLVGIPVVVSVKWFSIMSQTIGMGLNMIATGLPSAAGYVLTAFYMTEVSQDRWIVINAVGVALALLSLILSLAIVTNEPLVASDRGSSAFVNEPLSKAAVSLFEKFNVWNSLGIVSYVMAISVSWNIQLTMESALTSTGSSRDDANFAGTYMQLAGLPGVVVAFLLADKVLSVRTVAIGFLWPCLGSVVLLGERTLVSALGTSVGSLYAYSIVAGFFLSMISPVMFTLISNAFYPLKIPTVIMYVLAQVLAIIMMEITQNVDPDIAWYVQYSVLFVAAAFASLSAYKMSLERARYVGVAVV